MTADRSREWTRQQHREQACNLLDRLYAAADSEPPDYAPFLAALTHALLAQEPTP